MLRRQRLVFPKFGIFIVPYVRLREFVESFTEKNCLILAHTYRQFGYSAVLEGNNTLRIIRPTNTRFSWKKITMSVSTNVDCKNQGDVNIFFDGDQYFNSEEKNLDWPARIHLGEDTAAEL